MGLRGGVERRREKKKASVPGCAALRDKISAHRSCLSSIKGHALSSPTSHSIFLNTTEMETREVDEWRSSWVWEDEDVRGHKTLTSFKSRSGQKLSLWSGL